MRTKRRLKALLRRYRHYVHVLRQNYESINGHYLATQRKLGFIKKTTDPIHLLKIKIRLSNSQKQAKNLIAQRQRAQHQQAKIQADIKINRVNSARMLKYVSKLLNHYEIYRPSRAHLQQIKQRLVKTKQITVKLDQRNDQMINSIINLKNKIVSIRRHYSIVTHNLKFVIKGRKNVITKLVGEKKALRVQYYQLVTKTKRELSKMRGQLYQVRHDLQAEQAANKSLRLMIDDKNESLASLRKTATQSNLKIHKLTYWLNTTDADGQSLYKQLITVHKQMSSLKRDSKMKLNEAQAEIESLYAEIRYYKVQASPDMSWGLGTTNATNL